jgi:hypothetical protein
LIADVFIACLLSAGTQIQPAGEMICRGQLSHIGACYTQDVRQRFFIKAFHFSQIYPQETRQDTPANVCKNLSGYIFLTT